MDGCALNDPPYFGCYQQEGMVGKITQSLTPLLGSDPHANRAIVAGIMFEFNRLSDNAALSIDGSLKLLEMLCSFEEQEKRNAFSQSIVRSFNSMKLRFQDIPFEHIIGIYSERFAEPQYCVLLERGCSQEQIDFLTLIKVWKFWRESVSSTPAKSRLEQ